MLNYDVKYNYIGSFTSKIYEYGSISVY